MTELGHTRSPWMTIPDAPDFAALPDDAVADVCIVGAGIAGLSTAYLLAREGLSVIVLDDGPVAGGETSRTTAHLSNAIDDRYVEIERLHGRKGARMAAESHTTAINRIETIVREERISCDLERVDGYLFLAPGDAVSLLEEELAAARRAGLTDVEQLARTPLTGFGDVPCLKFPNQGQFHPLKYVAGLSRAITRLGGSHLYVHPRRGGHGRCMRQHPNTIGSDRGSGCGRHGHEHARQRSGRHPPQAGGVPDRCNWGEDSERICT